jgi:7-carboxy-7-deazaguanine synthase
MYAVDPAEVREHAVRMGEKEIVAALAKLPQGPDIVVLSGGNPALHEMMPLVRALHRQHWHVHVETQGSVWRPWLAQVDQLVVSPKPPSSGMATLAHEEQTAEFFAKTYESGIQARRTAMKIVVADDEDYEWAKRMHLAYLEMPFYVSACTSQTDDQSTPAVRNQVGDLYAWLCGKVATDPAMCDAVVLPQLHVVAYGVARGV